MTNQNVNLGKNITVTVELGEVSTTVVLPASPTPYNCMQVLATAASQTPGLQGWANYDMVLNGNVVNPLTAIESDSTIKLSLKGVAEDAPAAAPNLTKDKYIEVTILGTGGLMRVVTVESGSTVRDAILNAGLKVPSSEASELRIGHRVVRLDETVSHNDRILILVKSKGN